MASKTVIRPILVAITFDIYFCVDVREQASIVVFIASTRSDQICLASSEHLKKQPVTSEYFDN